VVVEGEVKARDLSEDYARGIAALLDVQAALDPLVAGRGDRGSRR
jgi:hypothetical protein